MTSDAKDAKCQRCKKPRSKMIPPVCRKCKRAADKEKHVKSSSILAMPHSEAKLQMIGCAKQLATPPTPRVKTTCKIKTAATPVRQTILF